MKNKNLISVTQARKNIFAITDQVQKNKSSFILTERGVPKAVIISVKEFEKMSDCSKGFLLSDKNENYYQGQLPKFPGTLIIRDESRVIYLSAKDQEMKTREENLIKAQLYIELVEKCKFPLRLIELGRYVRIGHDQSRRYIEADVIVNDEQSNVRMIFEVSCFSEYEKNLETTMKDLFDLADSLSWAKKPQYLIYFSRKCIQGQVQEKVLSVDYTKFNTFAAWKKAGCPKDNQIPQYG